MELVDSGGGSRLSRRHGPFSAPEFQLALLNLRDADELALLLQLLEPGEDFGQRRHGGLSGSDGRLPLEKIALRLAQFGAFNFDEHRAALDTITDVGFDSDHASLHRRAD